MTTLPANLADRRPEEGAAPAWSRHRPQPHWRNHHDEYDAAKLGMWLFLGTELLLFSGMFCAYAVFRMLHTEHFKVASHYYLDWKIGAINTVVLLISSFTVAMAIRNAQVNQQKWLKINLLITILCGAIFLYLKLSQEYIPKLQKGEVPGALFTFFGGAHDGHVYTPNAYDPLFLAIYWVATAIHGSHVLVGMCLLGWCLLDSFKLEYGPKHFTGLENVGLFWHLVDLIWIFLFPLLYLVG